MGLILEVLVIAFGVGIALYRVDQVRRAMADQRDWEAAGRDWGHTVKSAPTGYAGRHRTSS